MSTKNKYFEITYDNDYNSPCVGETDGDGIRIFYPSCQRSTWGKFKKRNLREISEEEYLKRMKTQTIRVVSCF